MKLDFSELKAIASKFKNEWATDGGDQEYCEGRHVYSIEFYPKCSEIRVHMAWPMLQRLVSAKKNVIVDLANVDSDVHLSCILEGVTCVAVVSIGDLKGMFEELGLPNEDHPINFDDSPVNLFRMWQSVSEKRRYT